MISIKKILSILPYIAAVIVILLTGIRFGSYTTSQKLTKSHQKEIDNLIKEHDKTRTMYSECVRIPKFSNSNTIDPKFDKIKKSGVSIRFPEIRQELQNDVKSVQLPLPDEFIKNEMQKAVRNSKGIGRKK